MATQLLGSPSSNRRSSRRSHCPPRIVFGRCALWRAGLVEQTALCTGPIPGEPHYRGHCTYSRIFTYAHWCASALAEGTFPLEEVDGGALDDYRGVISGKDMGFRGAIVQLQCDWEGLSQFYNVPTWSHKHRPCPLCSATTDTRHNYR
eukprot:2634146-Pyramimonas_sp.AAC.1